MTAGRLLPRGQAIAGPAGLDRQTRIGLGRAVAVSLGSAIACVGGIIAMRRLAGGFAVTPGPVLTWAVAGVGGMLVMATDLAAKLGEEAWPRWLARGGLALAGVAVMPLGDDLPWPARMLGLAAVAVTLVVASPGVPTLRWPTGLGRDWRRGGAVSPAPASDHGGVAGDALGPPVPPVVSSHPPPPRELASWPVAAAPGFRQRLERFEAADGLDCLRGRVILTVPEGSRVGHAHVGFCPPFAALPAVDVSTDCDLVEAAVSAAEVLPWGVRIECRLSEPAEESLEISVDLLARNPA